MSFLVCTLWMEGTRGLKVEDEVRGTSAEKSEKRDAGMAQKVSSRTYLGQSI